jgi:drug/metabolite transporter (DMT)-like permease
MLGGMALPFVAGILFYNEKLTLGKGICFAIITVALLLTVKRGEKKNGTVYYIGIFVLNGMSGVLSKIFKDAPFEKTSDAGYSVLCAIVSVILSFIILMIIRPKKKKLGIKSMISMAGCGILGRVANYILLVTLAFLPASAQYPFVTGGTMIMSTLLCYLTPNKPKKQEIIAVALSFIGLLVLMLVP